MKDLTISMIGAGGIGGFYGGMLAKNGLAVTFVLHSDYHHVVERGLKVESCLGNFTLNTVQAVPDIDSLKPADLLIIATKTGINNLVFPQLIKKLKPGGKALILQNGLGMEEHLSLYLAPEDILGATCFICSHKSGPGYIRHFDYGLVKIGAYSPTAKNGGLQVSDVVDLFRSSGIPVQGIENLTLERWKKLVWNIPFNGLSVLCDTTTDLLLAGEGGRDRVRNLMFEVRSMARACGYTIEEAFIEKMLEDTQKMVAYSPSMLLDFRAGKPMELETMYGVPAARSRESGYVPLEVERLHRKLLKKVN